MGFEAFAGVSWSTLVTGYAAEMQHVNISTGKGVQLVAKAAFKSWHSEEFDLARDIQLNEFDFDSWMKTNERQYLADMHSKMAPEVWDFLALALGDVFEKRPAPDVWLTR